MPAQVTAHLNYSLPSSMPETISNIEQHKEKATAAINHLSGIGHLLRCVSIDWETDDETLSRAIDDMNAGVQTAGDLIIIIADTAYGEVELMAGNK